jgi:hypothetical protein
MDMSDSVLAFGLNSSEVKKCPGGCEHVCRGLGQSCTGLWSAGVHSNGIDNARDVLVWV